MTTFDHCVYVRYFFNSNFIILLLYVDDMLIVDYDIKKFINLKGELSKAFVMEDLGPSKHIHSMRIIRDKKNDIFWLSRDRQIQKVLDIFNMIESKYVCYPLVVISS